MSTLLCVVPGYTEDAPEELRAAADITRALIGTIDHVLDRIEQDEIRCQVPMLLVEFIIANIAHESTLAGISEERRAEALESILARVREGWGHGLEAVRAPIPADPPTLMRATRRHPRRPGRNFTRSR